VSRRRPLILFGIGVVFGVASLVVWPGDLNDEAMTSTHWVALIGFLVAAVLLVVSAVMVVLGVVGSAWKASDFNPNEYLGDQTKR